jgi:hypothetical protein
VELMILPPSMSRLSRQCGILNISQSYRPPRPVTEIALLFLLLLVEVGWGDVDWIGLAQDRDRWRALVNSIMNFWVP